MKKSTVITILAMALIVTSLASGTAFAKKDKKHGNKKHSAATK